MNTILTDDEISGLQMQTILEYHESDKMTHGWLMLSRKVEAAVLAKLREQEPVAYGMPDTQLGRQHRLMMVRLDKGQDGCTLPLYATPLPAVVQVPQGWKLVPAEPTRQMIDAAKADENSKEHPTYWSMYSSMLAAAPEAPAQGDPLEKLTRIQEELGLYNDKPAQLPRGECFTNGNICARCGHPEFIEAPAQGTRVNATLVFDGERRDASFTIPNSPETQAIPAPWREAVKVAREALEAAEAFLLSAGFQSSDAYAKTCAALAQLDALEGGE